MQHRSLGLLSYRSRLWPMALAGAALACRADVPPAGVTPMAAGVSEVGEAPEATLPAGADELDGAACPSALPPCDGPSSSPCRAFCQLAANGCVEVGEFYPLRELPANYALEWKAFDPGDEHALYSGYDTSASGVIENFRWSASEGIVPLDPALRASDPSAATFYAFHQAAQDASAAIADGSHLRSFYWSRAGGVQPLDVTNPALAPAGGTIAGTSGRRALRWTAGAGREVVAELAAGAVISHAAGDAVLFVQERTITHVAGTGALTTLDLPSGEPADARFGLLALNASGTAFAVVVFDIPTVDRLTRPRLYLWSGQALERVELPGELPAGSNVHELKLSDDGRVIVAKLISLDFERWSLLRWSADEGARILHEARRLQLRSVSPAGDVIVAQAYDSASDRELLLRWSPEDVQQLDGISESAYLALDGDLFVDLAAEVPVQKFGRARAAGTLPIERLPAGFVPAGWRLQTLDAVSANARLLTGTAVDPDRVRWSWLSRSRAVCPEAQ